MFFLVKLSSVLNFVKLASAAKRSPLSAFAAGFFLIFAPGRGKSLNLDFQKPVASECPGCLPWRSRCYLARSPGCSADLASPCDALVVGPSWQLPSWSSWAAVAAEIISCTTPRECELRMPRGSHMAMEVAVVRTGSAACLRQTTGTITELPSQAQTVYSPGRCRSLSDGAVDRLYLKWEVQHTPRL
jgi:hypothetical protein